MPGIVTKYLGPMPKYQAGPIVLAATFAICALSWRYFEQPILGLKRFFWNSALKKPVSPLADSRRADGSRHVTLDPEKPFMGHSRQVV
jgi:peptidoglycan/LPS O-acetylase OafA/YrhL